MHNKHTKDVNVSPGDSHFVFAYAVIAAVVGIGICYRQV